MERAARLLGLAATVVVGVSLAATLAWAVATLGVRPLDGVEGDVLFEADRLRSGLALYTDPAAGAHDYGPVPARYLVLYPPVWSAILSVFPRDASAIVARVVALLSWGGLLAWIVLRAPLERRRVVAVAAAFVAGVWVLALFATAGRPDALAVLLTGVALERSTRRASALGERRIDVLAGALFALAAWVKPNVVGIAPGVFASALAAGGASGALRRAGPGVLGAIGASTIVAGVLTATTGRVWIDHLLASTGQPPSGSLWIGQVASRLPFFALLFVAAGAAGLRGRTRDEGAALATHALATSLAWCLLSLAKIGSASNYFLEPCVAALVVLARADLPRLGERGRAAASLAALVQAVWTGAASVRSSIEQIPLARQRAAAIAAVRETCGASPADLVIADEPGLERMMNGRIVETPFQSTHLARRGRFPIDAWIADLAKPEVRCLVMQDDLLERPIELRSVEHDRFGPELREALGAEFRLVGERGGFFVYARRARVDTP